MLVKYFICTHSVKKLNNNWGGGSKSDESPAYAQFVTFERWFEQTLKF